LFSYNSTEGGEIVSGNGTKRGGREKRGEAVAKQAVATETPMGGVRGWGVSVMFGWGGGEGF